MCSRKGSILAHNFDGVVANITFFEMMNNRKFAPTDECVFVASRSDLTVFVALLMRAAPALGAGIFPNRLHKILEDSEAMGNQHIISWLPCGKFFKIHDTKEFARVIMPCYFRHSKYKSFLRSLSMYKFQRSTKGPVAGAYGHPHFLRGRLDLCRYINRKEQMTLHEPQEPVLRTSSPSEEKIHPTLALDAFNGLEKKLLKEQVSSCDDEKKRPSLGHFGVEGKISPSMEPCMDDPSWSLYNNTPPEILDEIIATFAPKPSAPDFELF